ncbi:dTDP-4-dehydrorhamnose 3,5-epimerase [Candidatus Nanopelagicus abundans]|jgi:dTDP-4-dehydrorhamnose 3,5-epimerase|uniref:dTDP-4-dehydrorhamnose 3,5-epimerase n=1 Tax=Candidatus Nanopelagicus abundans TaxID=1884916 RepID=A0A249L5K4_9ACTN|nr:dTDP-4-dehydrorhamnose 3,5-epimerase [Candidatus Nanopelagicus abundans]ASY24332.1 dTDP-4-dehydrorhamnose 3,5-epimerase [Candidatus Nanopelagicus abundans]
MKIQDTKFDDVKIIEFNRHLDDRGFFSEIYKETVFDGFKIPPFVQDNLSFSSRGTIRGLHWQRSPWAQGKLVTCLTGQIYDVVVDIKVDSPTFGQYLGTELTESKPSALWVPPGYAHGFQALEDNTRVVYKVTSYWNSGSESSLNFNDPALGIDWRNLPPLVSPKDLESPYLKDLKLHRD